VGLSAVGLESEAAAKAVAMAMAGEYSMLSRYIPALRTATTEEEKRAVFARVSAVGYGAVAEKLNTVGGASSALKGAFENLLQSIGQAAFGGSGLAGVLLGIRDRVVALGESTGFAALIDKIKTASAEAAALAKVLLGLGTASTASAAWGNIGSLLTTSLELGGVKAANAIYNAMIKGAEYLRGFMPTPKSMFNPLSGGLAGWAIRPFAKGAGKASVGMDAIAENLVDSSKLEEKLKKEFERIGKIVAAEQAAQAANPPPPVAPPPPGLAADIGAALASSEAADKARLESIKKLQEERETIIAQMEEERSIADDLADPTARLAALDKEIKKLEDVRDAALKVQETAGFGANFDAWRQNKADAEASQKDAMADFDRRAKIAEKEGRRGTKLSREDQEFRDAFDQKAREDFQAQNAAAVAQNQIEAAQAARDKIQQEIKDLSDKQYRRLGEIETALKGNLKGVA
jgi:hypothetical protein